LRRRPVPQAVLQQNPGFVSEDESDPDVLPDVGIEVFDATEWSTDDELPISIPGMGPADPPVVPAIGTEPVVNTDAGIPDLEDDPVDHAVAVGEELLGDQSVRDDAVGVLPDIEDVGVGGRQSTPDMVMDDEDDLAAVVGDDLLPYLGDASVAVPDSSVAPVPLVADDGVSMASFDDSSGGTSFSDRSGQDGLAIAQSESSLPSLSSSEPSGGLLEPVGGEDTGGMSAQLLGDSSSAEEESFWGFSDVSDVETETSAPGGSSCDIDVDKTLVSGSGGDVGDVAAGSGTDDTLAPSSGDNEDNGVESVTSSDYQTCDDVSPSGSPGKKPPSSPRSGCSNIMRKKVSTSSGNSSSGTSSLRRSNRRKKSKYFLTYDSEFKQQSQKRYDLLSVQHK
jgi:hypothetical protein